MTKPSPLWRAFDATSPLFQVVTEFQGTYTAYTDPNIESLSITHGNGTPFGLSTGSADIAFRGVDVGNPWQGDTWLRIALTDYGADRVIALTGGGGPALAPRLTGRRVSEEFEDRGDPNLTRGALKYTAHDYGGGAALLDRGSYALNTDTTVTSIHSRVMLRVGYETPFEALNAGPYPFPRPWVETPDSLGLSTSDAFGKYGADLGILTRITRGGTPQSLTRGYRMQQAEDLRHAVAVTPGTPQALQRRQALSPITWVKNAAVPLRMKATWRDSAGDLWITERSAGDAALLDKLEEIDLTHVVSTADDVSYTLAAMVEQAAQIQFSPTDITIDMLHLLNSGRDDDKYLFRQMLDLEAGDPIALATDWPWVVSGMFFADKIVERISANGYTMTLTITPHRYVTGWGTETVAGRTWQQAYRAGWDAAPAADTWANAPTVI